MRSRSARDNSRRIGCWRPTANFHAIRYGNAIQVGGLLRWTYHIEVHDGTKVLRGKTTPLLGEMRGYRIGNADRDANRIAVLRFEHVFAMQISGLTVDTVSMNRLRSGRGRGRGRARGKEEVEKEEEKEEKGIMMMRHIRQPVAHKLDTGQA